MKITVAVCTWNRVKLLDQTLAEMKKLRIPRDVEWELIIVNNNCTDDTDKVIGQHAKHLPIRCVSEPIPGLSNARNAAVKAARGDYILWTDDDVLVGEYWIEAYVRAFERWPEAVIFGGPIHPWFEGKPPKWLEDAWPRVANVYAVLDLGPKPISLSEQNLPYGANYSVRLSAHQLYDYDPSLGRKRGGMVGYEESTLCTAMFRDGFSGMWVPEATVRHFIPRERQTLRYLRRYFHGQGLYLAGTEQQQRVTRLFRYPIRLLRKALRIELQYFIRKYFFRSDVWIKDLIRASTLWGQLQGSFELASLNPSDSVHEGKG